ncbi:CD59 glycoprotein [Sciurus carolinensis]|uniref:CD59 glycoprotein n=1 Tax=Sciurus carolinensis TaxID=30640 RepID=UPI001FB3AB00|nr:CD59 glycoprotein [Sciurus carolinensis]
MRSKEGLILLRILFILVVLCNTGSGLLCYRCLDPVSYCNTTATCSLLFDTCAIVVAGPRIYHLCWKYTDCNFEFFSKKLEEKELKFRCCQTDLCNRELTETEKEKEKEKGGTVTLSGKTLLPVMLVLVTSWNSFP